MSVIDVDPVAYESARGVFYDADADVVTTVSALSGGLAGGAGMAGCGSSGVEWATSYDAAAAQGMDAGSTATEALGHIGDLLGATGANHADADARSTVGGYPGAMTGVPGSRAQSIYCPDPPSANGSPGNEPPGWGLVAGALSWVWPNGHQDQLRAVATAWSTAASDLHLASSSLTTGISDIEAQRSPEVGPAVSTCTDLQTGLRDLADGYTGLSQACTDYAAHLDEAHQAVIEELESLLAWTIGIEVAGGALAFFTIGALEAAAQAAVAARIAAAVTRISLILGRLATLVRAVVATIVRFATRIGEILTKLKGFLTKAPKGAGGAAAGTGDDWVQLSGILRQAARGTGNFGLGSGTASQAARAGESWVGEGYTVASDGKTLISRDGLRQWRPPSFKPNLGTWQSNFESRLVPRGQWQGNGHLDITDLL